MSEFSGSPVEIHVDVVTDNVCPWCYVGKKKMEAAFAQFPGVKFSVDWVPYLLKMPAELSPHEGKSSSLVYSEFLCTRFGEQSAKQMLHTLIKAGEAFGVNFCHDRPVINNTIASHVLVQYAKRFGLHNRVAEVLMRTYCEEGADISDEDVLLEIAESVGLNVSEARQVINDPKCHEAVRKMSDEVRNRAGITSVPTFIVTRPGFSNFRLKFSGAQPIEYFVAAFKHLIDPQQSVSGNMNQNMYQCGVSPNH